MFNKNEFRRVCGLIVAGFGIGTACIGFSIFSTGFINVKVD